MHEKKNGRREEGGSVGQNGTKKKRTDVVAGPPAGSGRALV